MTADAPARLPFEPGDAVVFILALTMVLAAGLGVPHTEMLQDTLKSMIISIGALAAGMAFFWQSRARRQTLQWHGVMYLPLLLLAYALGSMVWSHTYLAAGEAIRWFVVGLLVWLGLNTLTRERLPLLVTGIHLGATIAALWAALQFWFNFGLFPQGPPPASTFVNRNFLAEFLVCTLPFSVWLLARARTSPQILLLSFSNGLCVLALLMTGTRSALTAMVLLALFLPPVFYAFRRQLEWVRWSRAQWGMAGLILLAMVLGLGQVGSDNPRINAEHDPAGRVTALERGMKRSATLTHLDEYVQGSFRLRVKMWQATARMMADRPLSGVGAGAWEVDIPLYQPQGMPLESDYYAHNDILQLLAEYGLVGWVFLLGLLGYLGLAAWRSWQAWRASEGGEGLERLLALASLSALLVVSCAGFPWRLASTGAMLGLNLGLLAAQDARAGPGRWFTVRPFVMAPAASRLLAGGLALCLALAAYISYQAAACEQKLVRAVSMGLEISGSGQPQNPRWSPVKAQMLQLMREGIAINPHYRKITPMLADELARWGDWKNALWIWESVSASRPYVSAILANIARSHLHLNQLDQAQVYFARAQRIQPQAPTVRTLEAVLAYRAGHYTQAAALAKTLLSEKLFDADVVQVAYEAGLKTGDQALALAALTVLRQEWPEYVVDAWLKQGKLYAMGGEPSAAQALDAYRQALAATPESLKPRVTQRIPSPFREQLQAGQTSSSKR